MYRTLVSEIMLQQTTVATVVNHFERFIKLYPNIQVLARATEEEICVAWKGLGHYRRARNLLKAAKLIVGEYSGKIPKKYEQLIQIPGVGDYTASALIAIGSDGRALCIDANIERVTSRLFGIKTLKGAKLSREIKRRLEGGEIYSDFGSYSYREFNEALMDLGRVICRSNKAECMICPVAINCVVRKKDPLSFPFHSKRRDQSFKLSLVRCVSEKDGRILVYQKAKEHWLSGQYELPTFILESEDRSLKQYPRWKGRKVRPLMTLKSQITKYKITNHVIMVGRPEIFKAYGDYAKLVYRHFSLAQNLSHVTFKILERLRG